MLAQCHKSEKTKKCRQKKMFSNGIEHRAENMRIFVSLAELNTLWHSMTDEMLACWDQQKCQAERNLPQTLGTVTTHRGLTSGSFSDDLHSLVSGKNIVLHIDSFMASCFMAPRLLFVFFLSIFPSLTSKVSLTVLMSLKRTLLSALHVFLQSISC